MGSNTVYWVRDLGESSKFLQNLMFRSQTWIFALWQENVNHFKFNALNINPRSYYNLDNSGFCC